MANGSKLSPDQVKVLMNEGTFRGLKILLKGNRITEAQAAGILVRSYDTLLGQVKEAKNELQRIQTALFRLESLFKAGKQSRRPLVSDQTHIDVGVTVNALDGWVVSLMETNLTITGMLNPAVTRTKIKEFGTAMNALMDKRAVKNHPAYDEPELFDGYVNNWRTGQQAAANNGLVK